VAAVAACALGAGAYAVPVTRAAVDDVLGSVSSWFAGDDEGLGRAVVPGDDVPEWLAAQPGKPRIIAEVRGVGLFVGREGDDRVAFGLGDSYGESGPIEGWRERLARHRIVVLGPGMFPGVPRDEDLHRPVFGLTARSVVRVELRYATGGVVTSPGVLAGGFALDVDAGRRLGDLVAFDAAGRVVERLDMGWLDLRLCAEVRGCPPGRLTPQRLR
jgi:hypothetical protein